MSAVFEIRDGQGNRRVLARMEGPNFQRATRRGLRQAWFAFAKDLKAEANREILRKPKSGRTYFFRDRAGRRRRHVASAPGETHANRTGALRRSLSWKVQGTDQMEFGYGIVGARTQAPDPGYGSFVEFGTRRMEARPSLGNAVRARQGTAIVHFEREILKAWGQR